MQMRVTSLPILVTLAMMAGLLVLPVKPARAYGGDELVASGVGAALGGFLGNQIGGRGRVRVVTTVGGAVVGGFVGDSLARYSPQPYYATNYPPSLPSGGYPSFEEPVSYPSTGYIPNYVAPPAPPPQTLTYIDGVSGGYCREYSQAVRINGIVEERLGKACLEPDGSWRVAE